MPRQELRHLAPLGPALAAAAELPDPNALAMSPDLNGELLQDGHTSHRIFSVAEIIAFLSGSTTLLPGTVILTGTPESELLTHALGDGGVISSGDEIATTLLARFAPGASGAPAGAAESVTRPCCRQFLQQGVSGTRPLGQGGKANG